MKRSLLCLLGAACAILAISVSGTQAQTAPAAAGSLLGARDFEPAPDHPIGWRGDWTGHFPAADPPTTWDVRGDHIWRSLRFSAAKPKNDTDGQAIPDGVIRGWLVLGPFPADASKVDKPYVPSEADLRPDEGDKVGDCTWKSVTGDLGVDFDKVFEKKPGQMAYAHVWLYTKDGGQAVSWLRHMHFMQVLVNGKQVYTNQYDTRTWHGGWPRRAAFQLDKGWNSVLFKVTCAESKEDWGFRARIWPGPKYHDQEKNIAWTTPIPWWSTSGPIVAGGKVFITGEPKELMCLDANEGKLLWLHSNTALETLTDEDKAANPEYIAKGDPLLAQLKQVNSELVEAINSRSPALDAKLRQQGEIEKKIGELVRQLGGKKYHDLEPQEQHGGFSCATPLSDGRSVYVWYYTGVASCLDLEGNLRWSRHVENHGAWEHGFGGTPALVNGRMVILMMQFTAFDVQNGKTLWTQALQQRPYATFGSLVPVRMGSDALVISASGNAVRASDGKQLFTFTGKFGGECPTPVVADGAWFNYDRAGVYAIKLPERLDDDAAATKASIQKHLDTTKEYMVASPLYHEGLLYCLDMKGHLRVLDMAEGKIVYEQKLPLTIGGWPCPLPSSPTLAGKYIYIMDSQGNTLVMEPGRQYKPVALNKIECLEIPGGDGEASQRTITAGNPWFVGGRIYVRGYDRLICIGEK